MIHLFLDDARRCPSGFVWAKTVEEGKQLLEQCEVGIASLDYDLGWGEPNGLSLVQWMVAQQCYPAILYLHSSSPEGRRSMYELLYIHKPRHVRLHVGAMPSDVLQQVAAGNFKVEK